MCIGWFFFKSSRVGVDIFIKNEMGRRFEGRNKAKKKLTFQ